MSEGFISLLELFFLHLVFKALFVKAWVEGVEVFAVELVGEYTKVLAEALVMHNLALSEESYRVLNIVVVAESENVVVGRARFLLSRKVFVKVGNRVAFRLNIRRCERYALSGRRINSGCVWSTKYPSNPASLISFSLTPLVS